MGPFQTNRVCALTFSCLQDLKFLRMRYVAAYLLCALGGNDSPSAKDLEKVLSSVGIEAEAAQIKKVIDELKGKDVEELIAAGSEKLASVPSGGGAAGGAAPAAGDAPAAEKKEEKKEESEESDDDM